jgi:hypothetical protein
VPHFARLRGYHLVVTKMSWLVRLAVFVIVLVLAASGPVPGIARAQEAAGDASGISRSLGITGELLGVAATAPGSAWAVGYSGDIVTTTLLLHWNGRAWSRVTSPAPVYGQLNAVTAVSPDNVWAVGATSNAAGTVFRTLILHWNGKTWSRLAGAPQVRGLLNGVSVSGSVVWAVGARSLAGGPLILRLAGGRWSVLPAPASGGILTSVAATGASLAWAVGDGGTDVNTADLLRWNGSGWRSVPFPLRGTDNGLWGMAAAPGGVIWSVGYHFSGGSSASQGTARSMRWNGTSWQKVPVSAPDDSELFGVAHVPDGTTWAVGFVWPSAPANATTLILHWTGRAWSRVVSPDPQPTDRLYAVTATSPRDAWAVGYGAPTDLAAAPVPLILHWNGKTWS